MWNQWPDWNKWPSADPRTWPKSAGDELVEEAERDHRELKRDPHSPLFYGVFALLGLAVVAILLLFLVFLLLVASAPT